ncbi:phosphodiester glycosidase family protein [Candidatus Woesearchaeota archaeon]|nr:phosphodiester glycosidase family protein [Candidatus Woesearchaeota archaeon]
MKHHLLVLALASAVSAGAPAVTAPTQPSLEYKKMRISGTTVHIVIAKQNNTLELIIASSAGRGKRRLSSMVSSLERLEKKNVLAATNGGYFDLQTGTPVGTLIYHGKRIIAEYRHRAQIIIDQENISFGYYGTAEQPFFDLLTGGPYLVNNNKNVAITASMEEQFDSYYRKAHPRTAIGKRIDGSVVLLVADGRKHDERGLRLDELANALLAAQCVEAINLDGGGSSTLLLSGEFYGQSGDRNYVQNRPSDDYERPIANGIVVVERKQ